MTPVVTPDRWDALHSPRHADEAVRNWMLSSALGWFCVALMLLAPMGCIVFMAMGPDYITSPVGLGVMLFAVFGPIIALGVILLRWRIHPFVRASAQLLRFARREDWGLRRQPVFPGQLPLLQRFQLLLHPTHSGPIIWQREEPWLVIHLARLSRGTTLFLLPEALGETPSFLLEPRAFTSPEGLAIPGQEEFTRSFVLVAPALEISRVQRLLRDDTLATALLADRRLHLESREGHLLVHWGRIVSEDELATRQDQVMHLARVLRRASADAFKDRGDPLPRADAHRRQAEPGTSGDHVVDERGRDPRTRRP
jgi:hypothetical protein